MHLLISKVLQQYEPEEWTIQIDRQTDEFTGRHNYPLPIIADTNGKHYEALF